MSHLNFWRSSHCIKWMFSEEDVLKAEERFASKWNITHREYNELFSYLTEFIFVLCHECGYDYHIAGIASILFRRIYQMQKQKQHNAFSFNDDPRLIAVVCVFVTAKSKDCNIKSIESFLNFVKRLDAQFAYTWRDVMHSEMICLKFLSFDLNIFLPFEACSDLLMMCNRLDILSFVWKLLLKGFKTNIYLLFPPYLIAIASIFIVSNACDSQFNFDFEVLMDKVNVPFQNINEVTKHIITKAYAKQTTNNSDKKKKNYVPTKPLKQIHLYYAQNKASKLKRSLT